MSLHKEISFATEICKTQRAIDLQREPRTALISDALSGQIKLRYVGNDPAKSLTANTESPSLSG